MMAEEFSHTVLHKNPAQVRAPLHPIRPQVDHVVPRQRPAAKNGTVDYPLSTYVCSFSIYCVEHFGNCFLESD